ncbi:MAG: leucine-rich repeat domain-containing protein [Candidatus Thorarchaeota archaeon]
MKEQYYPSVVKNCLEVDFLEEVIIRFLTTNGLEKTQVIDIHETALNLELRNIDEIDLLPLIWCTKLEKITLRHNQITDIDLTPLSKCINLETIYLSHNRLGSIDLHPLSDSPHLREVDLRHNLLSTIDISPLFHCSELQELLLDPDVTLTADLLLRSIGSWPDVLVDQFHRILWKSSDL